MQTKVVIKYNSGAVIQANRGPELKTRLFDTWMGGIDIIRRLITVEFFALPA